MLWRTQNTQRINADDEFDSSCWSFSCTRENLFKFDARCRVHLLRQGAFRIICNSFCVFMHAHSCYVRGVGKLPAVVNSLEALCCTLLYCTVLCCSAGSAVLSRVAVASWTAARWTCREIRTCGCPLVM